MGLWIFFGGDSPQKNPLGGTFPLSPLRRYILWYVGLSWESLAGLPILRTKETRRIYPRNLFTLLPSPLLIYNPAYLYISLSTFAILLYVYLHVYVHIIYIYVIYKIRISYSGLHRYVFYLPYA